MELDKSVTIQCPAKINLFLFIQKRRDDGYHELLMDLIPISLFDTLQFNPPKQNGTHLISNLTGTNQEDNLVVKAVRILEEKSGKRFSLGINLKKTIPWGAGLGGGSSNAANTLYTLNRLFNLRFTIEELQNFALRLGADVPFFLTPRPSLAKGIGERLTSLPVFSPLYLVLIFPDFPISTKTAYSKCQISKRKDVISDYSTNGLAKCKTDMNDFWSPLAKQYPILENCRSHLVKEKAIFTGMSGSGSTLLGVFEKQQRRDLAYKKIRANSKWQIFRCETLNPPTG